MNDVVQSKGKVRIEMTGHGQGKIWINDVEVQDVYQVFFSAEVGQLNQVELYLHPDVLDVTGLDHNGTRRYGRVDRDGTLVTNHRNLQRKLIEAQGQVISGFYEEGYPVYSQGMPTMELQDIVVADEVNQLVRRLLEAELAIIYAQQALANKLTLEADEQLTKYIRDKKLDPIAADKFYVDQFQSRGEG